MASTMEDDLYSGYNEYPSAFNTKDLNQDEEFQKAVRTSYGRRPLLTSKPGTTMRLGTSSGYREGTAIPYRPPTGVADGVTRPMTAVRGAGYTSQRSRPMFDPLNQAAKGPAPQLEPKAEDTPQHKIKKLEFRIMKLIEESCIANSLGHQKEALDKAKEASNKEQNLIRLHEQTNPNESHNLDLPFVVIFNLANQYAFNEMYTDSLNTYRRVTQNRMFVNGSRLKVNMGNIFYKLGLYPKAVKMYRMAFDQVPNTYKHLRVKIMHNIGILLVKMGQFGDACTSFEYIMQEEPDFISGFHMIVCYYALNDKAKMKAGFHLLLELPLNVDDDKHKLMLEDPGSSLILEAIKNDSLQKIEQGMRKEAELCILKAAKLIAPVIEDSFNEGYNWCVDEIKASMYSPLASDLEINKALMHLKQKDIAQAINTLKMLEKKETKFASAAAANLSFIYFLQGDVEQGIKYGQVARTSDRYNSAAYVNLGNCNVIKGNLEEAKILYVSALSNDASCVEALYNLGLVEKKMGLYPNAIECFLKFQSIIRHHPQVLYQLGHLHELIGDVDQATEWYMQVLGMVPSDPSILQKMGELYDNEGDKQLAYQYYYDSYCHYPSSFNVLDWLGSYFIELQMPEKAIVYFEKASMIQPGEVKWQLMVASCHRRSGNYHLALSKYKDIHHKFPENIECLKFLIRLCTDLGLKDATKYATELKKVEKSKEVRERISSSRPGSRRSGSGQSSRGGGISPLSGAASPLSAGTRPSSVSQLRSISGAAAKLSRLSLLESDEPYAPTQRDVDASYNDPLGPLSERPQTSKGVKSHHNEVDFGDEDIGLDLLPE